MVSTNRLFEKPAGQTDTATLLFNYQYDQLNRITGMDAWSQFNRSSNSFAGISKLAHYREKVAYDPNGNILKYVRHGNGPQTLMDSLTYEYYAGTNKLRRVRDSVFDANRYGANAWDKIVDIDDQVDVENYVYDSIGNLIRDKAEKITNINWNVYGKITGISREAGTQVPASEIRYSYDAAGNRISKTVEKNNQKSITWYVRDAQGNVMATYTSESASSTPLQGFEIKESERYLYGSSRLGVVTTVQPVDNGNAGPAAVVDTGGIFLRGERIYELSNHLGNVLVTVSDRKKGIADPITSSLINHFEPVMLSGTDYYPFGMAMRVGGDSSYRFGFNGQEMSNEIKGGEGNSYTAEFWEYDPRIGRRWNVDPVTKENESPYAVMGNNPIWNVDIDGADTAKYLNNSQLLAAIKIAYNVVKSHVDNKTFNIGQDYSGEVNKAMFSYLDENPNISFGGVAELKQQAFDYYKGFKEVAASVNGGATLDEFGSKILNNKNVNTTSTILLTQKLINSKNGEFGTVAAKGAEAFTIIMGAADPVAGSGSKGTRINSNRAQQIVNAAPAKNALSTTFETSLFRPTHAINRSKTQMQALLNDIKVHGIREPIKYVEQNGIKYIVDGHHRYYAAQKLGIKIIPAEQVQLPYGGYRTTQDLIFEGQMPGFWKNLK
jgi:RHS repeat-associated protein